MSRSPHPARPHRASPLVLLGGGLLGGALFGVVFGMLASLFEGGPPLSVAVAESWAWFAGCGGLMGLGVARARRTDVRRTRPTAASR